MDTSLDISRRQLLTGAGAGVAALLLEQSGLEARPQAPQGGQAAGRPVVFTHTTVVSTVTTVQDDVALVVQGGQVAEIGPTDPILAKYPNPDLYDGRGKAILPGLINTHQHMSAVLSRGFNEDYGFPNHVQLPVQPGRLLEGDENTLMIRVAALESMRTGTTTIVEYTGNIMPHASALAESGLRCVLAEGVNDREEAGVMSLDLLARSTTPRFSQKLREDGLQRINDLFSKWHGAQGGRISVFPAVSHAENCSPELLQAIRGFADKHNLGYTIHLNQSRWEADYMVRFHGLRPANYLERHGFLGPRLFAAHARYVDGGEIAALGKTDCIIAHQAGMAGNRGVSPPIPALRGAGCTIAMGTDNNTNDVFSVLRIALITERIRNGDDERPGMRPQPEDILEDATLGGAKAVNQEKTLGTLDVGKKADLMVIDTMKPYLQPHGRIVSAIVHGGNPGDIESVMVDGRFVIRDNKVLTMDEPAVLAEAAKVSKRVWGKVGPVPIPGRPKMF